jgi:hypothetical protein
MIANASRRSAHGSGGVTSDKGLCYQGTPPGQCEADLCGRAVDRDGATAATAASVGHHNELVLFRGSMCALLHRMHRLNFRYQEEFPRCTDLSPPSRVRLVLCHLTTMQGEAEVARAMPSSRRPGW